MKANMEARLEAHTEAYMEARMDEQSRFNLCGRQENICVVR